MILQSVDSVFIGRSCPSSNEKRGQPYPDKEQSSRRLMMFLSSLWEQVCEFRRLFQITDILKQAHSDTAFLLNSFFLSFFPPSFPFSFLLSFSSFLSFLLMSTTILGFFILKQTITNATRRKFKQYEKRNRKSCLKSYPHQHLGEGLSRHSWLHSTHAHTFTYSSFYFGNPLFSRMLSWKESQWIWSKVSFFSADMLLH